VCVREREWRTGGGFGFQVAGGRLRTVEVFGLGLTCLRDLCGRTYEYVCMYVCMYIFIIYI
jgi:hypothetical protein